MSEIDEALVDSASEATAEAGLINTKGGVAFLLCISVGLLGGDLFNIAGYGLNLSLFALLLSLSYIFIYQPNLFSKKNLILVPFGLFFVFAFSWHSSLALFILNLIGLFLVFLIAHNVEVFNQGFKLEFRKSLKILSSMFGYALTSPVKLVASDLKHLRKMGSNVSVVPKVLRGILLSVPFVIIFVILLGSADMRYFKFIETSLSFDENTFNYLIISFLSFFVAVGFLRGQFKSSFVKLGDSSTEGMRAGAIEVCTVLAVINFVFLSFIVIQLGYHFGDNTLVIQGKGITYATYAKQGFFELVIITLIALPSLWLLEWTVRDATQAEKTAFRIITLVTIILIGLIAASAIHRLSLYTEAYGLTEIRFYASSFLVWIVGLFFIFVITVLRGKRNYFLSSVLLSFIIMVAVLNVVNPDAKIAKTNMNRIDKTSLDLDYVYSLSTDAIPTIIDELNKSENLSISALFNAKCRIYSKLTNNHSIQDWRVWSLSIYKATLAGKKAKIYNMGC